MAPGLKGPGTKIYRAGHNLIRSHAKAYHVYKNEFKNKQNGKLIHMFMFLVYGHLQ